MDEKRLRILRDEPVFKAIMSLAIPTIMGMLVQVLYNLTDTFFVGKLNDPYQVAAVSVAFPLFIMLMAISSVFGTGGSSYISRLLGQKDYLMAKKVNATTFYSCIFVGIIVSFIGLFFISPILRLIGVTEATFQYASQYLTIIFSGSIIIMLNFSLGLLLRAEGAAKEAMFGMIIGTGLNIILDPIFIIYLNHGVRGAAIATLIGQGLGLLYYLYYYLIKKTAGSIAWKHFTPIRQIYAEIFKIGIPASLNHVLMSVANTVSNIVAASYSDIVIAAFGINFRVFSMAVMLMIGLATGTQPLIGYSYGSKNIKRFNETFKTASFISTGIALFFTVVFYLFPAQLIQTFINDDEVITYGVQILNAFIIGLPFIGIQMLIMVTFQALGKGLPTLILAISRQGLFFIPIILILNHLFGFSGFIYAQPIANILTFVLAIILFQRIKFQINNEHQEIDSKIVPSKLEESCPEI